MKKMIKQQERWILREKEEKEVSVEAVQKEILKERDEYPILGKYGGK